MPVEQANLHLTMLRPQRGLEGARQVARAVEYLYGLDGLRLHQDYAHGREPSVDPVSVDNAFLHGLGQLNGLPYDATQRELAQHYRSALDRSYQVVEYVRRKVDPNYKQSSGQNSKLAKFSGRPSEVLRVLASPINRSAEGAVDPKYQFEVRRMLGLALLVGDFRSSSLQEETRERIYTVNNLFDKYLFEGPEGANKPAVLYSYHDPATGEVKGAGIRSDPPKPHLDVKQHNPEVRTVQGNGPVEFYPREKAFESAVVKALVKSNLNGGLVATEAHVGDMFGARFVVIKDGRRGVELTTQKIKAVLERYPGGVQFEDDNAVDKNRGSGGRMRFNRFQVVFNDSVGESYEVIARDYVGELNAQYAYGRFDPKMGYHRGEAHAIYKLRNVAQIVGLLLPPDYYGDHKENIALQSQKIAEELKEDNTITYGDPEARPQVLPKAKSGAKVYAEIEGKGGIAEYTVEGYDKNDGVYLIRNGVTFRTSARAFLNEGVMGQNTIIEVRDGEKVLIPIESFRLESVV